MAEDPKKLTRAHKIALGIISAACCCLIGISAFALAAPDALNQGNLAEATQQANSASTDYGNDIPQEGQSDEAADQDGNTQDEGDDASGSQGKSTENKGSAPSSSGNKASSSNNASTNKQTGNGSSPGTTASSTASSTVTVSVSVSSSAADGRVSGAPTPPSRRALPPTMPLCATGLSGLARKQPVRALRERYGGLAEFEYGREKRLDVLRQRKRAKRFLRKVCAQRRGHRFLVLR